MGWIPIEEKMPPEGLEVLVEASGWFSSSYGCVADHSFYLGAWIHPKREKEGHWLLWDNCGDEHDGHLIDPTVHAWMPLPRHYQGKKMGFDQKDDLMEHSMFEGDPEWLYKGDCKYEQMTLEEFYGMAGDKNG